MYSHLLIAIDGSDYSQRSAVHGLKLAKAVGARATVLNVTRPLSALEISEFGADGEESRLAAKATKVAQEWVSKAEAEAKALGVTCDTAVSNGEHPFQEIIRVAKQKGCDAIVVGSHGRRGISGLLIGSETARLLPHAHVPVIVYRE